MKELHITVSNKIATYMRRDGAVVCGNSSYMIVFAFDEEWDAYPTKTARFLWNNLYTDVPFTGNTVNVPIVTDTTLLKVGVYAGDLSTTTPASIECKASILCGMMYENPEQEEPPEIPEGYIYPTGSKTITSNGSHDVREYATAVVDVESSQMLLQEEKTATQNGEVLPDEGYDGLKKVNVALALGRLLVDKNGDYVANPADYQAFKRVTVNVQPNTKTLDITENGVYDAADDSVDGYSIINVNVEGGNSNATTTALDFTDYERGSFTETLSNGLVITHTVEFDSDVPSFVDNIDIRGV